MSTNKELKSHARSGTSEGPSERAASCWVAFVTNSATTNTWLRRANIKIIQIKDSTVLVNQQKLVAKDISR